MVGQEWSVISGGYWQDSVVVMVCLTSNSQTDSKYLSIVSTKLWMNSSMANSFWSQVRKGEAKDANVRRGTIHSDRNFSISLPLRHHRLQRQKTATHICGKLSWVHDIPKMNTGILSLTNISWWFLLLKQLVLAMDTMKSKTPNESGPACSPSIQIWSLCFVLSPASQSWSKLTFFVCQSSFSFEKVTQHQQHFACASCLNSNATPTTRTKA